MYVVLYKPATNIYTYEINSNDSTTYCRVLKIQYKILLQYF